MALKRAASGARYTLEIDGQEVGWADSIRFATGKTLARVKVLGNLRSDGIEVTDFSPGGTMDAVFIADTSIFKYLGSASELGSNLQIIESASKTIYVKDIVTGAYVWVLEDCKFGTTGWSVARDGGLAAHSVDFECLDVVDNTTGASL